MLKWYRRVAGCVAPRRSLLDAARWLLSRLIEEKPGRPVGIDFVLNASFLSNADKEAILGGNAMKLLRISA